VLKIHEGFNADGTRLDVSVDASLPESRARACSRANLHGSLENGAGSLVVRVAGEPAKALPVVALERIMDRYGKPLAEEVAIDGPRLDLGEGKTLTLIRHLARYDVVARDFLVFVAPGREPLAELAVAVTGALVHLAEAIGSPADADAVSSAARAG
jgi:hypothetical protein